MPDPGEIVAWMQAAGSLLFALAVILALVLFRRPLLSWLMTANSMSLGPIELRRELTEIADKSRQVLSDTSKLQLLIAESRVVEIEISLAFPFVDGDQRATLEASLKALKQEVEKLKASMT
jgi:hypothetical protein